MGKIDPKKITAVEKALRLLGASACSERELALKLRRSGFPAEEIAEAVATCRRHGFLNDELLAEDYATLLADRGSGRRLIKMQLKRRGLAAEHVEAAVEKTVESELENARRALDLKLRLLSRETDPRKKKEKAFRFLAGRGFPVETIRTLFAETDFGPGEDGDEEWDS